MSNLTRHLRAEVVRLMGETNGCESQSEREALVDRLLAAAREEYPVRPVQLVQ